MSIIRALLAAGLTLGLSTHAAATAQPACSTFLNVSITNPESPSPVELGQVAVVVSAAVEAQHADAFPAERNGVFGMMKGGSLGSVGYSKHGHANQPKTFPDCLGACYDDCKCLAFHWSRKHARCGLKGDGTIPVSVDNRYQKTFRSFKRLEVTDCTPATTAAGTTTAEPTTTASTTSTTTEEPTTTTSTTSTTTEEPTTVTVPCSYTNSTTTFKQGFDRYFADGSKAMTGSFVAARTECAINTFDTSAVTTMFNLFGVLDQWGDLDDFNENISNWATSAVTTMARMFSQTVTFNQNINNFNTSAVADMEYMFYEAAAFNQNINGFDTRAVTTMRDMFKGAAAFNQNINGFDTRAVTNMKGMFKEAAAFNQNINGFNTRAVTSVYHMFFNAKAFNQTITSWVFNQKPQTGDPFAGNTLMTAAQKPIFKAFE